MSGRARAALPSRCRTPREIEGGIYLSSPAYLASYSRRSWRTACGSRGCFCTTRSNTMRSRGGPRAEDRRRGGSGDDGTQGSGAGSGAAGVRPLPRPAKSRWATRSPARLVVNVELIPAARPRCGGAVRAAAASHSRVDFVNSPMALAPRAPSALAASLVARHQPASSLSFTTRVGSGTCSGCIRPARRALDGDSQF